MASSPKAEPSCCRVPTSKLENELEIRAWTKGSEAIVAPTPTVVASNEVFVPSSVADAASPPRLNEAFPDTCVERKPIRRPTPETV